MGNTYTTICMNLKHKTDINAMGQCLLLDKERDILGTLDVGEAVVKLQGRIAKPFQIAIPEFIIEKGKITDAGIKERMHGVAPTIKETDFRIPVDSGITELKVSRLESVEESIENAEIEFLKDIQSHPGSGIAARYKRLGLSVRQGQKVKARLLEQGLIEEYQKTTDKGRLSIVRITEKGKCIMSP
jgi:predicted transcriptional regulator